MSEPNFNKVIKQLFEGIYIRDSSSKVVLQQIYTKLFMVLINIFNIYIYMFSGQIYANVTWWKQSGVTTNMHQTLRNT